MTAPPSPPQSAASPAPRVVLTKVFVRGLTVEAQIGVYRHEKGRTQTLVLDVELDVDLADFGSLAATVNYEWIAEQARTVAAQGHRGLVETFAHHLAKACLEAPKVTRARVRVEKLSALAPEAAAAGVEITAVRA